MTAKNSADLNFDDWPVPNDYLVEIGRLALLWARLETYVGTTIAVLAGHGDLTDARAYILFTHHSFEQNLQLLAKLCAQLVAGTPNLKAYPQVIEKLEAAKQERDRLINGSMAPNPGNGEIEMEVIAVKEKLTTRCQKVELADFKRAVLLLDDAQHSLYELIIAVERADRSGA
jgi:hypothetical protein